MLSFGVGAPEPALGYAYDLSGKRASMQWLPGTTAYTYKDFGALDKITDPNTNQYTFDYTLDGHVASMILGTGVTETRGYDFDGRLTSRSRQSSFPGLGTLISNTLTYDRLNRVIHSVEQSFGQQPEDTRIAYDGLGAVLANEQSTPFATNVEEFRNDALGNVLYRKTQKTAGANNAPFVMQYSPDGELLTSFSHLSSPPGQAERDDQLKQNFLGGGQLNREDRIIQNPSDNAVSLELATKHYYGADDKVMAVQRYSFRSSALRDGTWEEYWYDALGRRVLTRARRDPATIYPATFSGPLCAGGIQCRSFTERVWWDGDQALVEERTAEGTTDVSNSGLVQNIHGLTLDEPLAVITDQTRIVNYNWRGLGESSVFPTGEAADASLGNPVAEIDWPAATQADTYFTPGPTGSASGGNPKKWIGTFVANGVGTTGMLYRRNRYFNPSSGQFTQADPIGIAGGMNAFGFAGGDPLNYSDPFGLCPEWFDHKPCNVSFAGFTLSASWLTANYSVSAGEYGGQGETGIYLSRAVGGGKGTIPGKSKGSWLPSLGVTVDKGEAESLSALEGPGEQAHASLGAGWAVGGAIGRNSSGGSYTMSVGYGVGATFGGQGTNTSFYFRRKITQTIPEVRAQADVTAVKSPRPIPPQ